MTTSPTAASNLNDYVKFQMAEGLGKGEGGGTASAAAQLGAGLALGQQMAASFGAAAPSAAPPGAVPPPISSAAAVAAPPASGLPDLLSPADAAKLLGVSENDVLATLADGSLKGKKIGASWRIPRSALDEFLKS